MTCQWHNKWVRRHADPRVRVG